MPLLHFAFYISHFAFFVSVHPHPVTSSPLTPSFPPHLAHTTQTGESLDMAAFCCKTREASRPVSYRDPREWDRRVAINPANVSFPSLGLANKPSS